MQTSLHCETPAPAPLTTVWSALGLSYLIVHVLDVEGDGVAARDPFHPEIKPSAVVVFGMVGANPDVVLHKTQPTAMEEAFSTKERLPESNSELNRTAPSWKDL